MELEYITRHEEGIAARLGRPAIISVFGPPGAGKTTLLQHCEDLAWQQPAMAAVYVNLKDGIAAALSHGDVSIPPGEIQREAVCHTLQSLAQGLEDAGLGAKKTLDVIRRRFELAAGIAADASFQAAIVTTFGEQVLPRVSEWLVSSFLPLGQFGPLLSSASEALSADIEHLLRRRWRERDAALLLNPIQPLTDAFVEDLKKATRADRCVLLLDNLKLIWSDLGKWLRRFIQRIGRDQNVTWVLASWIGLPDGWRIRGFDFLAIPLGCLSLESLRDTLDDQELEQVKQTLQLFPNSEHEECFPPLLLREALEHPGSDDHCCERLAESIEEWLGDATLFEQVRQCAVARRIDRRIAEHLPGMNHGIWKWILEEGRGRFILLEQGRRSLDPQIRYALLRYTQTRDSMEHYRLSHLPLETFHQEQFDAGFDPTAFQMPFLHYRRGTRRWTNFVEWFYHALSSATEPGLILLVGLQYALFRLEEPDEINPIIDAIYQVARERREDDNFPDEVRLSSSDEEEGRWGNESPPYEKRFRAWGELLDQCVDELTAERADLDWEPIIEFCEAIVSLSSVHEGIAPKARAEATYRLGEAHRQNGDKDTARHYFEEALNLASQRQGRFWNDIRRNANEALASLDARSEK